MVMLNNVVMNSYNQCIEALASKLMMIDGNS